VREINDIHFCMGDMGFDYTMYTPNLAGASVGRVVHIAPQPVDSHT